MTKVKISAGIFPIDQFGKLGKIHSVFDRSFNIQVGERLLNVASYAGYLASFGIYLPEELFQELLPYVQQGNLVKIFSNGLRIYSPTGVKKISWSAAEVVSLQIHETLSGAQQALLKGVLLAQNLEETIGLPLEPAAQEVFAQLRQPAQQSPAAWRQLLTYLIGRGKGLTPSGDDLLAAYLVMLSLIDHKSAAALTAALAGLNFSTTDISREYLYHAQRGAVNSLMYQLYLDLLADREEKIEQDVRQLMQIGHSSGKDLCYGLLLALQAQ